MVYFSACLREAVFPISCSVVLYNDFEETNIFSESESIRVGKIKAESMKQKSNVILMRCDTVTRHVIARLDINGRTAMAGHHRVEEIVIGR